MLEAYSGAFKQLLEQFEKLGHGGKIINATSQAGVKVMRDYLYTVVLNSQFVD